MGSNDGETANGARRTPLAGTLASGSTLSVQSAFVVHFTTAGRPSRRRFRGRVEHLPSGRATSFSSLKELLAFFTAAVDAGPLEGLRRDAQDTSRDIPRRSDR
jgi:hypothetical protein